jgi:hypothetical protein
MRRIFWGFCRNWFLIDPLHFLSSRSDFGFEFAEIFMIEKRLSDLAFECLKENSLNRESLFEFFKIFQHFKRLNQHFKRDQFSKKNKPGM